MKLSVLIPTYNYTCYKLVSDLHRQLELAGEEYEIIVAEDGSKDQVSIVANHKITELSHCRHIVNTENLGRARVINFLIREAKGTWCIIMDSDAEMVSDHFIKDYLSSSNDAVDIVVGRLVNPDKLPNPKATLRYRYEKAAEPFRTAEYRNHHPYERFTTFNFMGKREALLEVPFDERCTEYGYEDTLMGIEMKHKGKRIMHTDNALMHLGFDDNAIFLKKTETALHTLQKIEKNIIPYTGMGRIILKLRKLHAAFAVRVVYKLLFPLLRRNLLSKNPNLTIFSFYKLGYYLSL